jgi:hypothetical protein
MAVHRRYKCPVAIMLIAIFPLFSRYQLLDRFRAVVKGFGDCYAFVKQKCEATLTSFSLKVVSKVLLDKDDEIATASERARLAYQASTALSVMVLS